MRILTAAAAVAVTIVAQPAAANSISGPRVEALLGWDNMKGGILGRNGLLYGVGAGYDVALGDRFSLGADAEISSSTMKTDLGSYNWDNVYRLEGTSKAGRDLYVGARVTGQVTERMALYARAGYADMKVKLEPAHAASPVPDTSLGKSGWRAGAGAQYLFSKAYAGLEYRYTDYGGGGSLLGKTTRNQIVGSVGYRF